MDNSDINKKLSCKVNEIILNNKILLSFFDKLSIQIQ